MLSMQVSAMNLLLLPIPCVTGAMSLVQLDQEVLQKKNDEETINIQAKPKTAKEYKNIVSTFPTSDVIPVAVVDFLYASVPVSQFPHPVHSTSDTGRQAQIC